MRVEDGARLLLLAALWGGSFIFLRVIAPVLGAVLTAELRTLIAGLALLSSAAAYLLYFRLIANVGPTRTLTVTYLMPAFGILWSVVFLDESLAASMLGGCVLIVLGTMIVLRSGATR